MPLPKEADIRALMRYRDNATPEPKQWYWGRDYGVDLLADLNQLAHYRGTDCLARDVM